MNELERRQKSSFLEAEGLKLPQQLKGHKVTRFVRIALMELLSATGTTQRGYGVFKPMWLSFFEQYGDDFPDYWYELQNFLRAYVEEQSDVEILALIQNYCRQSFCPEDHFEALQHVLEDERVAYRLVGTAGDSDDPPTLIPIATAEQAERLVSDYSRIGEADGQPVQKHLRQAAAAVSDGNFKASVRESIHAVESAAKIASGKSAATLPDALNALERQRQLHPALKKALSTLYGWTSDEKGIRHAEIGPTDDIPESMALFMLSSCAAFAAWLMTGHAEQSS